MVAAALNRTGILSIVDVILIICGIYCMVTAGKMKKNHVLPQSRNCTRFVIRKSFVRKWDLKPPFSGLFVRHSAYTGW